MIQMCARKQNIITSDEHASKTFSFPFLNLQNGMAFALTLITCFVVLVGFFFFFLHVITEAVNSAFNEFSFQAPGDKS